MRPLELSRRAGGAEFDDQRARPLENQQDCRKLVHGMVRGSRISPGLRTKLEKIGTPGGTRTPDARLRTPPLYPTELQGQGAKLVEIAGSRATAWLHIANHHIHRDYSTEVPPTIAC
jgi:hypothetical protein